jgi:alpha-methylacyl-CoA racemase
MLDGITVLDLSSVGPAARASRWLADYGASVVKITPKDPALQLSPPFHAYSAHRGMTREYFDMKDPADRGAFLGRAAESDVVIESFRPGVVDKLGIGYGDVKARNPGIVYCSTSGYGQDGPRAQWAGHDLNYLAMTGFLAATQPRADGGPPIPGATVADSAGGGMQAVIAILAALVRRSTTGEGAYLDVSVYDGVLALMALHVDEHLATGEIPHNVLTGRFACYDTYATADGRWLAVAAIEPRFWANLCRLLGVERWTERQTDDAAQDEIRADLRRVLATKTRDEWTALLAAADTCVTPVLEIDEVDVDTIDASHPDHGSFRQMAPTLAGTVR